MTKSRLQELLNKCDEGAPMSEEDKGWDQMQPVGKGWKITCRLATQLHLVPPLNYIQLCHFRNANSNKIGH